MNRGISHFLPAMLAICLTGSMVAAQTASSPPQRRDAATSGPLGAEQLRGIRGAGRSVLGAQRQGVENVDIIAAREALQTLRQSIDTALVLRSQPITLEDKRTARKSTLAVPPADSRMADIRVRWSELKTRRVKLQTSANSIVEPALRARMKSVSVAVSGLEDETDQALRSTGQERLKRLMTLRERLAPQALDQRMRANLAALGSPPEAPTPTMLTITEHR